MIVLKFCSYQIVELDHVSHFPDAIQTPPPPIKSPQTHLPCKFPPDTKVTCILEKNICTRMKGFDMVTNTKMIIYTADFTRQAKIHLEFKKNFSKSKIAIFHIWIKLKASINTIVLTQNFLG